MTDIGFVRRVALLLALPVIVLACSIPVDDQVDRIDPDRMGGLQNTTTTSTTTTSTTVPVTTTLEPPVTDPAATEAPSTTTTTTIATRLTPVTIYYTLSNTETLQSFRVELPGNSGPSLEQVTSELQNPIADLPSLGLQTAVRPGLITGVSLSRAVLTVTLAREVLDSMSDSQKRRAVAQIVLTFTSFTTPDSGAVAFVSFVYNDGEQLEVPLPATGSPTADLLAFEDFKSLITGAGGTTTVPPPTEPPPPATSTPPDSPA
jgi:hypothetical protein